MTFAEYAKKSVSDPRVLIEMDIGFINTQWVNNGAGIWAVDAENIYEWVDSSLLEEGFSALDFGHVGSVQRDGLLLDEVLTLGALTDATDSFYYDANSRMLYVCLDGYDAPDIHAITIGVIYGYSYDEFTPPGAPVPYEGRIAGAPNISIARDPLYYGMLTYGGGSIRLINNDGAFDTFQQDHELYGNPVRIYIGYADLDYDDYMQVYTGLIDKFRVGRQFATFDVVDKRKSLTINAQPVIAENTPGTMIAQLITTYYPKITYDDNFFNTWAWMYANGDTMDYRVAFDASIVNNEETNKPLIDHIAAVCAGSFFIFWISPTGLFIGSAIDYDETISGVIIRADDILNDYEVIYDPSEVISSVYVGYAPTGTSSESVYHGLRNSDYEASVFNTYKVYKEHKIETPLANATAASAFAEQFMRIHKDIRGAATINVPLRYYPVTIGMAIWVELKRPNGDFIGTTLCATMSMNWILERMPYLQLGVRFL
jgi:hypothetical protein